MTQFHEVITDRDGNKYTVFAAVHGGREIIAVADKTGATRFFCLRCRVAFSFKGVTICPECGK